MTERPPAPAEATPPPEPAPGPVTDTDTAPVWVMPDQGPGGTIPVALGNPTSRKPGPGGTGKSRGGGGPPESHGTAVAKPRPVSIASIKKRPMPIGDTDFVDAHKDYPPEAKRLGIEGTIKVRLVVDDKGAVTQRKLLTRLGYGLDELALKLAARLQFSPAIDTDDKPVSAVVVWTFHFTLPG